MATRPVFLPAVTAPFSHCINVDFIWNRGLSVSQKQKNIRAIHEAFTRQYPGQRVLEISSKSLQAHGPDLSAFRLSAYVPSLGQSVTVENIYQSGKVFTNGGPYTDLLTVTPKAAKKDERLQTSGRLTGFRFEGISYPASPPTVFYDFIYITALLGNPTLADVLLQYDAFTDIEYAPDSSIACQAKSAAIFVALHRLGLLDKARSFDTFLNLFIR